MNSNAFLYILLLTLISTIGLSLLIVLFVRLRQLNEGYRRSKHQLKREGMTDLLQCSGIIKDGVIINKNGSLTATFFIKGIDYDQAVPSDKEYISARINNALVGLDNGWMIHMDAIRVDSPKYIEREKNHFSDLVSYAIDEERRTFFENRENVFEGAQVLSVTYLPPLLAQRKFVELLFDDNSVKKDAFETSNAILNEFERQVSFIESNLSSVFQMFRMKSVPCTEENGDVTYFDEQLQYMQYCITGINQPIRLPPNSMFLNSIIGGQDLWTGTIPKIGDQYVMTVSIDGFPLESYPGILNVLTVVPCECRFNSRFQFVDKHVADSYAGKISKKWKQKQRGMIAVLTRNPEAAIDSDAVNMTIDAEQAVSEIRSGYVSYGFYSATVVLMDSNREKLEKAAAYIHKKIQNIGFNARIETVNTLDAYLGTIPGHGTENLRRYFIHTLNLADFLPTNTIWVGEKKCPCPFFEDDAPVLMHTVASGRTPYRKNLHVGDVGHTAIIGPTGAGKSTLLAAIIAQFRRYKDSKIFCFDNGMSLYAITKACGGIHFDLGNASSNKINKSVQLSPFSYINTPNDQSWLLDWVEKVLLLNKIEINPEERNEIGKAISSLADTTDVDKPDLTKFLFDLQSTRLREALAQYDVTGSMGYLLSGKNDTLDLTDFTTFEMSTLLDLGLKWSIPVLLYIFRRIEKSLTGKPTLLIIDEAWATFKHDVFREQLFEWLKLLRKRNCSVILATQDINDIATSGMMSNIRESTSSKIFLPNPAAKTDEVLDLYKGFGLNSRQIDIIVSSKKKQDYYHQCGNQGSRLYNMALQPLSLAFLAASDPETIQKIIEHEIEYGPEWTEKWANLHGLSLEPYRDSFNEFLNQQGAI